MRGMRNEPDYAVDARNNIVEGIANYMHSCGLKTMVLGLSGGLDSTVCAALCRDAKEYALEFFSEKIELLGISLPCSTNSKEENDIAKLCSVFCDRFTIVSLEDTYQLMKSTCETIVPSTPISQGNIKARLRMTFLYNVASVTNGIVIDTDNLTECNLGFWTIHGDDGDLNPIGCLWKTEVYDLAKLYKHEYEIALRQEPDNEDYKKMLDAMDHAIEITPTDGNGVKEGGDLAQIAPGYTYNDVDKILHVYLKYASKCLRDYPEDVIDGIISRYKKSAYKRLHRPLVIDIEDGKVIEKNKANEKYGCNTSI